MQLSAPTQAVFVIAVLIAILAIVGTVVAIPFVSANAFWVAIAGFVVLAAGNLMKGM